MYAHPVSPHRSSGTPMIATETTSGMELMAFSTSFG